MAQKQFIIDGGFTTNADSSLTGNLDMTGHIIPTVDSDGVTGYDLGSPDMKWRDLYLSQGSLYIDGQKVIESNSGTIVVQADPGQSLTTKVSGAGVMTLESDTTVTVAATLQMASGKRITDQGGSAVVFGDKVDLDNNQLINLGSPTADGHATTKLYVDQLVGAISTDAITEGDTEIEIADLGTGTVGITVDGSQRLALSGTAAAFTVPVTVNGVELADVNAVSAAVSSAEADANTYTDSAVANLVNAAPGALDTLNELAAAMGDDANFAATVSNNIATAVSTASADATSKADAAQSAAEATASADATSKANAAQSAAISAAASDATSKANAAEADAIATASADATAKANAAQSAAIAASAAALTSFHSGIQDVTSATDVTHTFSELVGAKFYQVFLNRQLIRPSELASVNLSTGVVTFAADVVSTADEVEVNGFKA